MQWVKWAVLGLLSVTVVLAIALVLPAEGQGGQGFKVIANRNLNLTTMSKADLSRVFLKKLTRHNGNNLEPADQDPGSTVREVFSRDVHSRSVSAIKSHWQRQIFSGRGTPPPELSNDAAVVSHVNGDPGGIGYVSVGTAPGPNAVEVTVTD
jgi:ABC-type phosphate transport system substrate-binding protein